MSDPALRKLLQTMSDDERHEVRRSLRCPCGPEGYETERLRVTAGDTDAGEQTLAACEEATGERPDACPWAAFNTPFVLEVVRARRWRDEGELSQRYPHGVPNVVVEMIDTYDNAFNAVQVHDMREDREAREEQQRQRELDAASRNR